MLLKTQKALLPLMTLAVASCVSPSIYAPKSSCTDLVPDEWKKPIEPAKPPPRIVPPENPLDMGAWKAYSDAVLKGWVGAYGEQTGQLKKESGRKTDSLGIIDRCQKRDIEAIDRSKSFFQRIF